MILARFLLPPLCVALLSGAPMAGLADDGDHDRARQALRAGEVLPLPKILQRVDAEFPGEVIEVELERHRGRWVYEIKTLRGDGTLLKLLVDAGDGRILGVRGRDGDGSREGGNRRRGRDDN
ncbi:MAG TPA: PepSY domain-containing protein [Accumulibacter sp.]|jgi:uncharacterized membrane protein YkoI|nr:PepSY domain-containing protein [Accumulibacter sp.]HQC79204.1 PepSY domain-containing protein [Accumulibacter sp.]